MAKVANSGHDENGRWQYGTAGDQTGTEWYIRDWYYFRQNVVLRHPEQKVRNELVKLAKAAAANNRIGYDQMQRTTFWRELQRAGYDPSRITTPCESDCSAGVAAIVKAAGYRLNDRKLQAVSEHCWTGNLRAALMAAGFKALYGDAYCSTDKNLIPGDINLNESQHVNITVSAEGQPTPKPSKLDEDGLWGSATTRKLQQTYGTYVDGEVWHQWRPNLKGWMTSGWKFDNTGEGSPLIRAMQKHLNTGDADGLVGQKFWKALMRKTNTSDGFKAVREMQKRLNKGTWK